MTTLGKVTAATAARLRAAHPDIPTERLPQIVLRSIIGGCVSVLGLVMIVAGGGVMLSLMLKNQTPSALGFTALGVMGMAGLFLFGWGLLTAAGRVVKKPLQLVVATFGGMVNVWRGRGL